MVCKKCGYKEQKEVKLFGSSLCKICATFAPDKVEKFQNYISEKQIGSIQKPLEEMELSQDKNKKKEPGQNK